MSEGIVRMFNKVFHIIKTEGPGVFVAKVFSRLLHVVYSNEPLLLIEHTLERTDYGDLAPKGVEADLKVLCSPEDLESLSVEGYDLSRLDLVRSRKYLANKGMLFCIFIQRRVATLVWVSMSREVDFDPIAKCFDYQGRAFAGVSYTWPEFRGLGLYKYVMSEICKVLKSKGVPKVLATITPGYAPTLKALPKLGWRQVGRGRLLRIFGRSNWRLVSRSQDGGESIAP